MEVFRHADPARPKPSGADVADLELTGPQLLLRPWRPQDVDRICEIMQDRSMHTWLVLPDPYTRSDAEQWVGEIAPSGRRDGSRLAAAVVELSSDRLVGSAELRLGPDPEIGYWIAPDARGHGFAAEAADVLATWAVRQGAARVRLMCDVRNVASAATALRAGFHFEGVSRAGLIGGVRGLPERRVDLARFARLPGDPAEPVPPAFPRVGELTDDTLVLRPLLPHDADALGECADELSRRWGFTPTGPSAADVRRRAERAGLDRLVGGVTRFAMVDAASGRLAGSIDLRLGGPPQVGGIGYTVHPAFRGRRYATRALRLLCDWAFTAADFARLELGAKLGNDASIRTAVAAGFEPDGVRRARLRNPDGSFSDEVRFYLLHPRLRAAPDPRAG